MEIRHELTQGQQLLTIELHLKIVRSPLCEPAMSWPLTPVVHEIQDSRPPGDRSFLFLSITQENVRVSHQITIVNKKLRFFLKFIIAVFLCGGLHSRSRLCNDGLRVLRCLINISVVQYNL